MTERAANRKNRVGRVVSDVMDKTVVVTIERRVSHPLYGKSMRRVKRLHAHDEENAYKVGDIVRLVETRPLSKTKRWRVAELLRRDDVLVDVSASPSTALPVAAEALDAEMVAVAAAAAAAEASDETEIAEEESATVEASDEVEAADEEPATAAASDEVEIAEEAPATAEASDEVEVAEEAPATAEASDEVEVAEEESATAEMSDEVEVAEEEPATAEVSDEVEASGRRVRSGRSVGRGRGWRTKSPRAAEASDEVEAGGRKNPRRLKCRTRQRMRRHNGDSAADTPHRCRQLRRERDHVLQHTRRHASPVCKGGRYNRRLGESGSAEQCREEGRDRPGGGRSDERGYEKAGRFDDPVRR